MDRYSNSHCSLLQLTMNASVQLSHQPSYQMLSVTLYICVHKFILLPLSAWFNQLGWPVSNLVCINRIKSRLLYLNLIWASMEQNFLQHWRWVLQVLIRYLQEFKLFHIKFLELQYWQGSHQVSIPWLLIFTIITAIQLQLLFQVYCHNSV